jgi:hypothetical protein
MSAAESQAGMTYDTETTELKAEFDEDFDTDDDEQTADHVFTNSCFHSCYWCP